MEDDLFSCNKLIEKLLAKTTSKNDKNNRLIILNEGAETEKKRGDLLPHIIKRGLNVDRGRHLHAIFLVFETSEKLFV